MVRVGNDCGRREKLYEREGMGEQTQKKEKLRLNVWPVGLRNLLSLRSRIRALTGELTRETLRRKYNNMARWKAQMYSMELRRRAQVDGVWRHCRERELMKVAKSSRWKV